MVVFLYFVFNLWRDVEFNYVNLFFFYLNVIFKICVYVSPSCMHLKTADETRSLLFLFSILTVFFPSFANSFAFSFQRVIIDSRNYLFIASIWRYPLFFSLFLCITKYYFLNNFYSITSTVLYSYHLFFPFQQYCCEYLSLNNSFQIACTNIENK